VPQALHPHVGALFGPTRLRRLGGRGAGRQTHKINAAITALVETLGVPERTVARWRQWWLQHFACTALWQEMNARFMPPVQIVDLPLSLIERFTGAPHEAMLRFLTFLSPLSVPT
jgi:hypothetical protein